MRYLYGQADEKFVKPPAGGEKKPSSLSSFKYRRTSATHGETEGPEFKRADVPLAFKCTPDTLLNICVKVVDAMPLPTVYAWTTDDICRWLKDCGYRQYQNTFRENLISGRTLLTLDAAALSAMNIKDFDHIKELTRHIRDLFYFEMTKFAHSVSHYPEFPNDLYKLFRVKTGAKYELARSNLWRKMQIIRRSEPNYSHWETLEHWLNLDKAAESKELVGAARRTKLYACKSQAPVRSIPAKHLEPCSCLPPCECYSHTVDSLAPWRLKCLPALKSGGEFAEHCCSCVPPCTCRWSSKMYRTHGVLTCLQLAFPHKYGERRL